MPEKQTPKDALFEELSLLGLKAVQNYSVNKIPVAIAFPARKIAVEVDDSLHEKSEVKAADEKRDAILESLGWRVLRIRSKDVDKDPTKAASDIEHFVGDEPEMIEEPQEETNDLKTPETKALAGNKLLPKAVAKTKKQQPKTSLAKISAARAKSKNKKSAKRVAPSLKRSLRKKTGKKQADVRKHNYLKNKARQKKYSAPQPDKIIGIALLLIALYLLYLLMK